MSLRCVPAAVRQEKLKMKNSKPTLPMFLTFNFFNLPRSLSGNYDVILI